MERSSERSFERLAGVRRALMLMPLQRLSTECNFVLCLAHLLIQNECAAVNTLGGTLTTPSLETLRGRMSGRTEFRQTIHLSVAEIKSFSQLSPKKGSQFRHA